MYLCTYIYTNKYVYDQASGVPGTITDTLTRSDPLHLRGAQDSIRSHGLCQLHWLLRRCFRVWYLFERRFLPGLLPSLGV